MFYQWHCNYRGLISVCRTRSSHWWRTHWAQKERDLCLSSSTWQESSGLADWHSLRGLQALGLSGSGHAPLLWAAAPCQPAQLLSKGTRHQPFRKVAVFMVKIHIYIKKKKKRGKCSPPGSARPGCSQNKAVSKLQQVSFSELKGSQRKRVFFGVLCVCVFFLRHFNRKVKNKWNESKPFGCHCFSWCLL